MTPATWAELERLFELALATPAGERGGVLDRACAEPALRREVDALLAADERAGDFLESEPLVTYGPGERIGPYRLLDKLGEGETSSVYLAERDDEHYTQQVALKLLRPDMGSRQILARFHQERQILASLQHPNIARLLDGGRTPSGQPYFVMEHVAGRPLDQACAGAPLQRRLALFATICDAVHAAHTQLVVHRDLKPSNILVGGDGAPKLLDFGIAKLLGDDRLGYRAEPTAALARLMTPRYASPEQVQGRPVGTASDVYSLGVILYELVTGQRPYQLGSAALHDLERAICEATPLAPSQRVRALPRDLDNIVGMAMRKQPERRYPSAQALADDIRRCVERRPVIARRDTLGYRLTSLIRRRTGAVIAAAIIAMSIIAGTVATVWQWREAIAARGRAERERETTAQALAFVVELFHAPGSAEHDVTARELIERGAVRLDAADLGPAPLRPALAYTLGVIRNHLGEYRQAEPLLMQAVIARVALGSPGELADGLYQLGAARADNGEAAAADATLHQALAIRDQLADDAGNAAATADILERIADNIDYRVGFAEGEAALRRALALRRRTTGDRDPRRISTLISLAGLYIKRGWFDAAEPPLRDALAIRSAALGAAACGVADDLLNVIGVLRFYQGYLGDAERYMTAAIACVARDRGPSHVDVADARSGLVAVWRAQGRLAEAEALARDSLTQRRALHGEHHPAVDNALQHLAEVRYDQGALAEAEALVRDALARREAAYGHHHDSVAVSLTLLADIIRTRDPAAAEPLYRDALAVWRAIAGGDHPETAVAMRGLAQALAAEGHVADARLLAEAALALQHRRLRADHPAIARTLVVLAQLAATPDAAAALLRDALAIRRAALPPGHPAIGEVERLLAHWPAPSRAPVRADAGADPDVGGRSGSTTRAPRPP